MSETIEYKGYTITIEPEEMAHENSPDEWGNTDIFLVAQHDQFEVERKGFMGTTPEEINEYRETHYVFPVYAYIHGGVALSLGNTVYPFNDRWDSGQVGLVLAEKKWWHDEADAECTAASVIEAWNQFLSGDVWYYRIDDADGEHVESLGSVYGYDDAVSEAQSSIDFILSQPGQQLELFTEK